MDPYVPALMLLSAASFIHSRSNVPELRPESEASDTAWKYLSMLAFWLWIGLLVWGAIMRPWTDVALGFVLSLAFNLLLALRGPRPVWPGLSMVSALLGIGAAGYLLLGR
jgi:hypothetical protein